MRDLLNQRFGKLLVTAYAGRDERHRQNHWLCLCDCGVTKTVFTGSLTGGATKSCGCERNRSIGRAATKHGRCGSRVYHTWQSMNQRCHDPNCMNYYLYGGAGIKVCERWRDFRAFLADMGEPPTVKHSIDRIDPKGDYEPANCRWATAKEQNNNKSTNRVLTIDGVTKTLMQWADATGIPYDRIRQRLNMGFAPELAIRPGYGRRPRRPDTPKAA